MGSKVRRVLPQFQHCPVSAWHASFSALHHLSRKGEIEVLTTLPCIKKLAALYELCAAPSLRTTHYALHFSSQ